MTILDLGCGKGFFTLEMAKLLNGEGKVIAIDVKEGMLDLLRRKLKNNKLSQQNDVICNPTQSLGFTGKTDFILAFYTFHEMKYIDVIIKELKEISKPHTKILISEQIGHVSKSMFKSIVSKMSNIGFGVYERPKIFLSRSVVMKMEKTN